PALGFRPSLNHHRPALPVGEGQAQHPGRHRGAPVQATPTQREAEREPQEVREFRRRRLITDRGSPKATAASFGGRPSASRSYIGLAPNQSAWNMDIRALMRTRSACQRKHPPGFAACSRPTPILLARLRRQLHELRIASSELVLADPYVVLQPGPD